MRSIRLVARVSSPVPSARDETKMNAEKHESSLLTVVSDVGSTPTASTIFKTFGINTLPLITLPALVLTFALATALTGCSTGGTFGQVPPGTCLVQLTVTAANTPTTATLTVTIK